MLRCDDTLQFLNRGELRQVGVFPYYSDMAGNLSLISTHYRAPGTDTINRCDDASAILVRTVS
jgi:hypothetical protein